MYAKLRICEYGNEIEVVTFFYLGWSTFGLIALSESSENKVGHDLCFMDVATGETFDSKHFSITRGTSFEFRLARADNN